ncbi:MAG: right-handed parallel beta-helix repeat-containing protein [Acidobacteria bacterium]|nr:right-handed parallel beta-helix repeat-containing protein [Acidobacteriota bacterium]
MGVLLLCLLVYGGNTYYVANGGSNGSTGTSLGNAWETLQYAANNVTAGDTVLVADGTYAGFELFTSGSPGSPITFMAMADNAVINTGDNVRGDLINVENADYVVVDGFVVTGAGRAGIAVLGLPTDHVLFVTIRNCVCVDNFRWGIFTGYAEDVLIENNTCSGADDEHGIYVSNSADRPIIRDNVVFDNVASGIQINADPALPGDGIISNAHILRNIIYNNGTAGGGSINLASVRDSLIANNLVYDNLNTGIAMWDDGFDPAFGCKNNLVANNTVIMAPGGRWASSLSNGSTGNTFRNNILLHRGTRGGLEIDASSKVGLDTDFNVIHRISDLDNWILLPEWQMQGYDANSLDALPPALFVNEASDDYHLSDTSPARDAGTNLAEVLDDLEGNARPVGVTTDIGSYEYGGTPPQCGTGLGPYFENWLLAPQPPNALDVNLNGWIDIADAVTMVNCL